MNLLQNSSTKGCLCRSEQAQLIILDKGRPQSPGKGKQKQCEQSDHWKRRLQTSLRLEMTLPASLLQIPAAHPTSVTEQWVTRWGRLPENARLLAQADKATCDPMEVRQDVACT